MNTLKFKSVLNPFTWPLTFFDFKHLDKLVPICAVDILYISFPEFGGNGAPAFDSQLTIPKVFVPKGHQEANCGGEESSFLVDQVLPLDERRVYLEKT